MIIVLIVIIVQLMNIILDYSYNPSFWWLLLLFIVIIVNSWLLYAEEARGLEAVLLRNIEVWHEKFIIVIMLLIIDLSIIETVVCIIVYWYCVYPMTKGNWCTCYGGDWLWRRMTIVGGDPLKLLRLVGADWNPLFRQTFDER